MRRQLQGIALILIGILFVIVCIIDPWIPVIESRILFAVLAAAASIAGLVLVFRRGSD